MMMMMTMRQWPPLCVFVCIGNKNVNSIDQKKKKGKWSTGDTRKKSSGWIGLNFDLYH